MQWKKYPFGEEFPFFIKRCHFCQDDATRFCKSLPWDEVGEERASTVSAQTCRSPAGFLTEEYIFIKPLGISGKTWRLGLTSVSEAEWGESPFALGRVVHRHKLLPKRWVPGNNETALTIFKLPDVVGVSGGSQRGGGQSGAGVRGEAHQEQQQDGAHLTINKGYIS